MQRRLIAAPVIALLAVLPVVSARGTRPATPSFRNAIPKPEKALHALDRLTFGPRPGDVAEVERLGVMKWIEQQLHPESIAENPVLDAKLRPLESLRMSSLEIARAYPPPQMIVAVATGKMPPPQDPELKALYERLAERYRSRIVKKGGDTAGLLANPGAEPEFRLDDVLTAEQIRTLRRGKPEEKVALLRSLPQAKLDDVVLAIPPAARRAMFALAPTDIRRRLMLTFSPQQVVAHDLAEAKLYRALYSERQLAEVLDDFWFNHFNVYLDKGADRYLVTDYERDVIRPRVLGHFSDLLRATAESPAMLFYLDNWQSVDPNVDAERKRRNPKIKVRGLNENYARELLELHTLGVDGGYTQKDIIEVARCFTGWTIREPRRGGGFEFDEKVHDKGEKVVLGVTIPAGGGKEDGLKVLDIVARHASTARFVSRKLAQRFVADNPPDSLVRAMAKTFSVTDGDIRRVLETMFRSKEFWSEGAYRAKVKSPFEMVASALRATGAEVNFGFGVSEKIAQLGEPLYRKLEPTGYSNSGEEWISSASLLGRMNFALALAQNQLPGVKVDQSRFESTDPGQIARSLMSTGLSPATRAAVEKGLEERKQKATPPLVAGLVLGSPDFQKR